MPKKSTSEITTQVVNSNPDRLAEITGEVRNLDRSAVANIWQIGKLLAEARPLVPYGRWAAYLESEYGWSYQYASRLMAFAEGYPDGLPEGVGLAVLYAGLSVEESLRSGVLDLAKQYQLKAEEVKAAGEKLSTDRAEVASERERLASPEYREQLIASLRPQIVAESQSELDSLREQNRDLIKTNRDLEKQIKASSKDEKQSERLRRELAEKQTALETVNGRIVALNTQIAELTRAAASHPVERVTVPPSDYEALKEANASALVIIGELEREVAALKAAPEASVEFLARYETLQAQYARACELNESRAVKLETVLRERRLYRERCKTLEALLTSHGIEFERSELPMIAEAE